MSKPNTMHTTAGYLSTHPELAPQVIKLTADGSLGPAPATRIKSLVNLKHLIYRKTGKILRPDLAALKHATQIQCLDLEGVIMDPEVYRFVASFTRLTHLGLYLREEVNFSLLASLSLTSLGVRVCYISTGVWQSIFATYPKLERLTLNDFTAKRCLKDCLKYKTDLKQLRIENWSSDDQEDIIALANCTQLRTLKLRNCLEVFEPVRRETIPLQPLTSLTKLRVFQCSLTPLIPLLPTLTTLKIIACDLSKVTGGLDTLLHLARNVTTLELTCSLHSLDYAWPPHLSCLRVSRNLLSDDTIAPLECNTTLTELDLSYNRLTKQCLSYLSHHPSLTSLNLCENDITDFSPLLDNSMLAHSREESKEHPAYRDLLAKNRNLHSLERPKGATHLTFLALLLARIE